MTSLLFLTLFCGAYAGHFRHPFYQGLVINKDPIERENEIGKSYPEVETQRIPADRDVLNKVLPEELEAYYYGVYGDLFNSETQIYGREGNSTETASCEDIRSVPEPLRHPSNMRPRGLSSFYQKYTEAYNIPVLASSKVPDEALTRACYVLRFLLADRSDLREQFYKSYGRIAVMATTETTTNIPEHAFLSQVYDQKTRGLGAIPLAPVSTAAVENILCLSNDTNRKEDILLREIAQGIQYLAARKIIPDFRENLRRLYERAISSGWWRTTYASLTPDAYFGEGVQSYFNVNSYGSHRRGTNNHVNNRSKLRMYDPHLYMFIEQLWPCGNSYLKRCSSRGFEYLQKLTTDCHPFRYLPL